MNQRDAQLHEKSMIGVDFLWQGREEFLTSIDQVFTNWQLLEGFDDVLKSAKIICLTSFTHKP